MRFMFCHHVCGGLCISRICTVFYFGLSPVTATYMSCAFLILESSSFENISTNTAHNTV